MRLRELIVAAALLTGVACAVRGPVVDRGAKPEGVGGTISGMVTAGGSASLAGRKVTAIDESTGARIETSTASNGGYTMKVPTGKYKLELELHQGERLAKSPDPTQINVGDLDPGRDFVVTVGTP